MAVGISTSHGSAQKSPTQRNISNGSCQVCITSSRRWATSILPKSRWKSGQPRITSWAAYVWTATLRCQVCPVCSPRANAPRELMAQIGWEAIRFPTFWCSESDRANLLRNSPARFRSEEHTSELQSRSDLVCRLLLEKKKKKKQDKTRTQHIEAVVI